MSQTTPHWLAGSSVYQINPRTFSSDGTIASVILELPDLKSLGFHIIYLCPIFKADDSADPANWSRRQIASRTNNPKNPYRMNDYFEIDREYGTLSDLKELSRACHALDMKLLLDLVYLHIGPNADILKTQPDFAMKNPDGTIRLTPWNFPYLNYECEGLREYLWCNMVYYIAVVDVDGFRCDVGDRIPLDFWAEGKRRIQAVKPQAIMINEGEKAEYLSVFDANYSFRWHNSIFDLLNADMTAMQVMEKDMEIISGLPAGGLVLRDMDNHDTVTDWPYRIEAHYGSAGMELILAINYTLEGIPMVYCGNELADTARLSMFANRFHPGSFSVTDRRASGEDVDRRRFVISRLNRMKAELAPLCTGRTEWDITQPDAVLKFDRYTDHQRVTFIGNFSDETLDLTVENIGSILLSNRAERNSSQLKLLPYGYVISQK